MTAVRRYAQFRADFPDDHIWDASGEEVIQTGGKAVARAVAGVLAGFGCVIHGLQGIAG